MDSRRRRYLRNSDLAAICEFWKPKTTPRSAWTARPSNWPAIQYPELEAQPFLDQLNELASRLGDRLRNFNDGRDFVETAQRYLFQELGFHGNEDDYYDPLNSCLNQVLERRTGIPVTLSVMYMEIARRLADAGIRNRPAAAFQSSSSTMEITRPTSIRSMAAGRSRRANASLLAGARVPDLSLLRRVSKKQIVMRMLQNLHGAYLRAQDWAATVETLDLLIAGFSSGPAVDPAELAPRRTSCADYFCLELKRYQDARAGSRKISGIAAGSRPTVRKFVKQIRGDSPLAG